MKKRNAMAAIFLAAMGPLTVKANDVIPCYPSGNSRTADAEATLNDSNGFWHDSATDSSTNFDAHAIAQDPGGGAVSAEAYGIAEVDPDVTNITDGVAYLILGGGGVQNTDSTSTRGDFTFNFAFTVPEPEAVIFHEAAGANGSALNNSFGWSTSSSVRLLGGVATELNAFSSSASVGFDAQQADYECVLYPNISYSVTASIDGNLDGAGGANAAGVNSHVEWSFSIDDRVVGIFQPQSGGGPVWNGANWGTGSTPNGTDHVAYLGQASSSTALGLDVDVALGELTIDSSNAYTINGTHSLTLQVSSAAARLNVFSGNHTINSLTYLASDTVAEIDSGSLTLTNLQTTTNNITKTGAGLLEVNAINAASLTFQLRTASADTSSGTVKITAQGSPVIGLTATSTVGALTMSGTTGAWTGKLDLTNTNLVVHSASVSTIRNLLKSGYDAGAWDGNEIDSSIAYTDGYALGYAPDSVVTGLSSGDVLVQPALYGDANLDGIVNFSDFAILSTNYNSANKDWFTGDFNYDGNVNGTDFALLSTNLYGSLLPTPMARFDLASSPDWQILVAFAEAHGEVDTLERATGISVPEPSALAMLSFALCAAIRRRRKA